MAGIVPEVCFVTEQSGNVMGCCSSCDTSSVIFGRQKRQRNTLCHPIVVLSYAWATHDNHDLQMRRVNSLRRGACTPFTFKRVIHAKVGLRYERDQLKSVLFGAAKAHRLFSTLSGALQSRNPPFACPPRTCANVYSTPD